ncbi:Uncharacterized protein TCM_044174 [Theobroma cacao]|uniref:Uncharacterized protein n=1 Tax=Theobroma cacao TaxID=3641 RepID=A0A061FPK9_THECC|nr:Uncharacterized protein TCM_044174 [Theobroma cacao]
MIVFVAQSITILSCKGHTSLAQQESIVIFFLFGKNKLSLDINSDSCVNPNVPVIPSDYKSSSLMIDTVHSPKPNVNFK